MPGQDGRYEAGQTFDYHPVQPFEVKNRKGILTHPAWLIAFSANAASDPIRRGRWIREKLLAGVVPDVPITVDAKVPDDPHRTLCERVAGVTRAAACAQCHSRMNDLGNTDPKPADAPKKPVTASPFTIARVHLRDIDWAGRP
jgi:hypothetical protein